MWVDGVVRYMSDSWYTGVAIILMVSWCCFKTEMSKKLKTEMSEKLISIKI